ncbi:hypothetical protein PVAG01_00775 [Phlyctema vagabunda]|uniref:ATPase synthesis protein 25 n=1 Tax=Phlyctema vagabunda TaxID=108571 RepID=A0ABR4PWK2_9HELO
MVVTRAIRASNCASCRSSLIKAFTSVAGHPARPAQTRYPTYQVPNQRAPFSSRITPDFDQQDNHPIKVSDAEIEQFLEEESAAEADEELAAEEDEPGEELSNIPWYLQVDTPQRPLPTLSERQRIPDLPPSPPKILEPMLNQISIDLGLDDLTLLDLRKLEPPAALGSNLIMVLGTARSEKHLHVAADRLCRWLRTNYKLRPDADGLLGRNELKLKLRRKNRRAKLMGTSQMEDADDGVKTGWVCVNVGVVEGPTAETESAAEHPGFIGFGRRTDGISLVVQMLTEEKRAEIELEKLWEGILRRATEPQIEEDAAEIANPTPRKISTRGPSSILSQTRRFHTYARRLNADHASLISNEETLPLHVDLSSANNDFADTRRTVANLIQDGKFESARDLLIVSSSSNSKLQDGKWQPVFLNMLKNHLECLPREEILVHLGKGCYDYSSTPLLSSLFKSLSIFPTQDDWDAILWLRCVGIENEHPKYTLVDLVGAIPEMQLNGGRASVATYIRCIRALLWPFLSPQTEKWGPSDIGVRAALIVLQIMYDEGIEILSEDIFVAIMEATEVAHGPDSPVRETQGDRDTFYLPRITLSPLQERLRVMANTLDMPSFSEATNLRLLSVYARQQSWPAFWERWSKIALAGQARTPEMYTLMFQHVAAAQNEKVCIEVLRTWIPDMRSEQPAIVVTQALRQAIARCLHIVNPYIIDDAADASVDEEWTQMWRSIMDEDVV